MSFADELIQNYKDNERQKECLMLAYGYLVKASHINGYCNREELEKIIDNVDELNKM